MHPLTPCSAGPLPQDLAGAGAGAGGLPDLPPADEVESNGARGRALVVGPLAISFVVFPHAALPACLRESG